MKQKALISKPSQKEALNEASADGRGFAVSGGVAQAVVNRAKELAPEREVKVMSAEGLENCRKMLTLAKAGKLDGYLLEGMACPRRLYCRSRNLTAHRKNPKLL